MKTFILLLCFTVPILGQLDMYTVKNYPDPIDRPQACGRISPSFICDPTNIIPEAAANVIDGEIKAIYNETTVPCYSSGPRESRRKGYMVFVALMPKMNRFFTVNTTGYGMATRYREAQHFAYYLGQEMLWGKHSAKCKEIVIILYSENDGVLYTSTQSTARRLLTDEKVQDTVLEALTMHYPFSANNRKVSDALIYIVRKYGLALREDTASV